MLRQSNHESDEGLLGALHPLRMGLSCAQMNGVQVDVNMTDANLEISQDGTTIEGYFSAYSLNAIMHYEMANPDVDIHCIVL